MAYDSPNNTVRREHHLDNITGIADTMVRRILFFQKTKVKKVHGLVIVAGTNAVAGFDLLNGTTSVGAITFGTTTAGSAAVSGTLNAEIAAGGFLEIKGKATSATLVASLSIEHEVMPEAVQS